MRFDESYLNLAGRRVATFRLSFGTEMNEANASLNERPIWPE
jgi:hypothetical protein